jgi:hypothetical protein
MHDRQWRTGTSLPVRDIPAKLNPGNSEVDPFKEIDDRPGIYTGLRFTSPQHYQISYFYSDSLAKENVLDEENEYVWDTAFHQLAVKLKPEFDRRWTMLSQFMWGRTWMGKASSPGVSTSFKAFYLLLNRTTSEHGSASVRFDRFMVSDLDDWNDNNDSSGTAFTIAYRHHLNKRLELGAEFLRIDSNRRGNTNLDRDPSDNLFQLMARIKLF